MTQPAFAPRWVESHEVPAWQADEILPGLFMGGTADDDVIFVPAQRVEPDDIKQYDAVVTLYGWATPATWEVEELRYGFMDSDIAYADIDRILRAARWAHDRWRSGDRVLIRCQAGLNRSGLVTALVLMRRLRRPRGDVADPRAAQPLGALQRRLRALAARGTPPRRSPNGGRTDLSEVRRTVVSVSTTRTWRWSP
jgi:hypothetical protein